MNERTYKKVASPSLRFPGFRQIGGWEIRQLKDVCQMQAGKFVSASEIHEIAKDSLHPCYGGNGLRGFTKTSTHTGKYSLIGRQGALCGNVTLADGKFHATEHAVVATPRLGVNTEWLYYMLTHLNLNQYATGQAQPGLSVENLEKIPSPIPADELEQKQIADCLTSIDQVIVAESQKLNALKAHKKGLMQQLFPAEGETVPKLRFPAWHGIEGWNTTQLRDVCRMQAGKFVSAPEIQVQDNDELYPCYGGNGLRGFTRSFTHSGAFSLIGRQGALCGNVTFANGQFHATEHAIVTTPFEGVDTRWLFYLLVHLNLNQYATGQAQPGLSVENLEKIPVKIPDKIDEQRMVAGCLSSIDDQIDLHTKKTASLKRHKKALLQQLFPNTDEVSE